MTEPWTGNVKIHHQRAVTSAPVPKYAFARLSGASTGLVPDHRGTIDWDRLIDKRPLLPETLDTMPKYLLKPEVLTLLEAETHPMHRLILDLMW